MVTAVRVAGMETRLGPERMADGQGRVDLVFPPGDVELRVREGGFFARAILTVG